MESRILRQAASQSIDSLKALFDDSMLCKQSATTPHHRTDFVTSAHCTIADNGFRISCLHAKVNINIIISQGVCLRGGVDKVLKLPNKMSVNCLLVFIF